MFRVILNSFKHIFFGCHTRMADRLPVVVILGATGTGKSKLAIEVAQKFKGEVISADSMQVYKGLDIITNKVSPEELMAVPHHLVDFVDPIDPFTVFEFRNAALPLVLHMLDKGTLPVIVGGTNYYIESLLWTVLVENAETQTPPPGEHVWWSQSCHDTDFNNVPCEAANLQDVTNRELYERLRLVDPEMAKIVHPNDRRKVLRSLQVYGQHGRTHSEILAEQKRLEGGSNLGGPLRFPKCCMLWLHCDQKVLEKRLDDRVDDMMRKGLIAELQAFHCRYNEQRLSNGREADFTTGIFQSIGLKEFHTYLTLPKNQLDMPDAQKLLQEGVERLKLVTRRYTKTQLKWIKHRFLQCRDRQVPPVFHLDVTDPTTWEDNILRPAIKIISSFVEGTDCPIKPLMIDKEQPKNRETVSCAVCDKILVGEDQWKAHLRSKKHLSLVKRAKKQQQEAAHDGSSEAVVPDTRTVVTVEHKVG